MLRRCRWPPLLPTAASFRLWRKPGWQVAVLFTIGSVLFVVSGAAALVTRIGNPTDPAPGAASAPAGFIGWPNAIAANFFFFPAGLIQVGQVVAGAACMSVHAQACGRMARQAKGGWDRACQLIALSLLALQGAPPLF